MEEKIGVWINKPLYRKIFKIPNIKGGNWKAYAYTDIDISELNIDTVASFNGIICYDNGYMVDGNAWYTNTELSTGILIADYKTILRIRTNQEWAAGGTAYVTLYYTKKID